MATKIIKKGRTRLTWYKRIPWPVFRAKGCIISGTVHPSWAQVEATEEEQQKWNKLGGISWGFHHRNSVRLGIRYNPERNCFELCEYRYTAGKGPTWSIMLLPLKAGQQFRHRLSKPPGRLPWLGYRLSIMWGDPDDNMFVQSPMDFTSVKMDII